MHCLPFVWIHRSTTHLLWAALCCAALLAGMLGGPRPAAALLYIVTNTNDSGAGSLRRAITDANFTPGFDAIRFNIPGEGTQIINLLSVLPSITDPVSIDGLTQPGASCAGWPPTLRIQLDGTGAQPQTAGLRITAGGSTVKGLAIIRFDFGIQLQTSGNNEIQCNYIGMDVSGAGEATGNDTGIEIRSNSNMIGGGLAGQRNLIANSTFFGIHLRSTASENTIQGNYIGTTPQGTVARPNEDGGIKLDENADGNVIGGAVGAGNLIAGNNLGIYILTDQNKILGNRIGVNAAGNAPLPNTSHGVIIEGGDANEIGGTAIGAGNVIGGNEGDGVRVSQGGANNRILGNYIGANAAAVILGNGGSGVAILTGATGTQVGGNTAAAGNLIAHNLADGVTVIGTTTVGNLIRNNYIYANNGLGIDLRPDGGVTANDFGDSDDGGNELQNYPRLTQSTLTGDVLTVQGQLRSKVSSTYTVEFFLSNSCNGNGYGEGQLPIGDRVDVTTNPLGLATFEVAMKKEELGGFITATATSTTGNTSEFSECIHAATMLHLPLVTR